ncbi:MAG TPA: hypothetical protein VMZ91_02695 [Candidatus Paceibacterota bacterium]|nr:hypothetical protein [Candidatus Paceibacterota bacterium]
MAKCKIYNIRTKSPKGSLNFNTSGRLIFDLRLSNSFLKSFSENFKKFLESNELILTDDEASTKRNYSKNSKFNLYFDKYRIIRKNKFTIERFELEDDKTQPTKERKR